MPATLLPQQRQCSLNDPERTEIVGVKHSTYVGLARFLNRADQTVTGIIEDDVKLAKVRVSLRNGMPSLIGIGHVECQGKHGVAEAFLQIGNTCQFAGGRRDFVASLERGFGPDASKTA